MFCSVVVEMDTAATSTDKTMVIALVSIAVLGWLFCAFSTSSLARANGRDHQVWFALGLLLGPLALVIGFLMFRSGGERQRRKRYGEGGQYDVPEMVRCPKCGESVPKSYGTCQFCGASLQPGKRR